MGSKSNSKPKVIACDEDTLCPLCNVVVGDMGICCDMCNKWFDLECAKLDDAAYSFLSSSDSVCWFCSRCSPGRASMDVFRVGINEQLNGALRDFREKLVGEVKKIVAETVEVEIAVLDAKLLKCRSDIGKLVESGDVLMRRVEALGNESGGLSSDGLEQLRHRVEQLEVSLPHDIEIKRSVAAFDRLDLNNRRHDILVHGVPADITDLAVFVGKLSSCLGVVLADNDLSICRRVPVPANAVLVQFTCIAVRDKVLSYYFKKMDVTLAMVIGGDIASRIYLNENLQPRVAMLKRVCSALRKKNELRKVAVFNGRVCVTTLNGKQFRVSDVDEVRRVIEQQRGI